MRSLMRTLHRWRYTVPLRLRSLLRRDEVERDLDDEIHFHLDQQVHELVAAGVDPLEARRIVVRRFGAVDLAKEECRDARRVAVIETLVQDIRYAARVFRRNPGFTVVAVVTLALGSGANTAVFSLVDGVLLSRLPYPDPDRLVSITGTYPNGGFAAMREQVRTFDAAAYAEGHAFTLTGVGEPVRLSATRISAGLIETLGVKPELGRWLRPGEDVAGRDRVLVISHALWESKLGRDNQIIGRFLTLDGVPRQVVAVMPASFHFPSARTDLWVPLGLDASNASRYWAGDYMPIVGRLRPGRSMADAHADIRLFQSQVGRLFPWRMPADWNRNVTVVPLQEALVGSVRPQLLILIAAVALVLVIACANVANLSLSRAFTRQREIGIRTAIGAEPRRIARQLLTESMCLASLGAIVGLLFATEALAVLKRVLPADTPRLADVHLNWRVLAFTAGLAVMTGCAAGSAPVLHALRLRLRTALDSGGRGGRQAVAGPLRAALTIGQVACAVLLVIAAGLLVRSLWTLTHVDPGFDADHVVIARVSPMESLCSQTERCLAFYRTLESGIESSGGVRSAALVNTLPLTGAVAKRSLEIEGYTNPGTTDAAPLFWLNVISPDYFDVMRIPIDSGRAFTREDLSGGAAVAIVSASTARKFWPGRDAIGSHVRFVGESTWHTIVGVVADVRAHDLTRSVPEWIKGTIYVPHGPSATQEDGRIPMEMTLALRTSMEPGDAAVVLRETAGRISREVVIGNVRPMRAVLADAVAAPAATASLLVTMAALALVLGCVGVYGVLSFLVSRQTRDLGIRVALGAQARDVFWLVIREGALLCLSGIAIGICGALAITRWLSSELHGISPTDPVTYVSVAVMMLCVTFAACYLPTRRAMGVDPLLVLRDQ
jgi:putative ABC transport system permease protein